MRQKGRRIPIDELLDYWIDISKRPTLTLEDYALFFERAHATVRHFTESYPRWSDKFFDRIYYMVFDRDRLLNNAATERNRLAKEPLINLRIMAHCGFDSRATVWTGS
jgi:hypothetical protein